MTPMPANQIVGSDLARQTVPMALRIQPVIETIDVVKVFEDTVAVNGLSLAIQPGERVGIVGPNGAGKTTTLLMLLGAIDADSGIIRLNGHDLPGGRSTAMLDVGFAAGYLPLPDRLKVHEALQFFADLTALADPAAAVEEVLDELEIRHLRDQSCMTLSSGQATLVGIAKAALHRPKILILDEPTASLDPDVAMRVRDQLAHLNEVHDTTLLLTSHDMREVETLTDRVLFLREGSLVADGPTESVARDAGHDSLESMFLAEATRMRSQTL
jgi:ABC-2 type transport system ATP-binding protein